MQWFGFVPKIANYVLDVYEQTDVGMQRDNNQDSAAYWQSEDQTTVIAVVADGMGGHKGGEVASKMAVDELLIEFKKGVPLNAINGKRLEQGFKQANLVIHQQAQTQPELNGMGTTLVALAIHQGKIHYANVGDSRLYRIRNGRCEQLTEDHSLVANLLKGGLITAEEAASHPDKNVITRSIGTYPDVDIDCTNKPIYLELGDCFLLCSDGLHDLVKPEEMIEIITGNTPKEACQQLIKQANAQGGHDNITALIINVLNKLAPENKNPKKRYQ